MATATSNSGQEKSLLIDLDAEMQTGRKLVNKDLAA